MRDKEKIKQNIESKIKIVRNRAQCLRCGDIIESKHVHDFQTCKCWGKSKGKTGIAVDGGLDYLRRVGDPGNYKDLSVTQEISKEKIKKIHEETARKSLKLSNVMLKIAHNSYKKSKNTKKLNLGIILDKKPIGSYLDSLTKDIKYVQGVNDLNEQINNRTTEEISRAIVDACDLIIRLRLGQFDYVFETLIKYMEPNKSNIQSIRTELHQLIDLLCDLDKWHDKKYKGILNSELRDFVWKLQCQFIPLGQPVDLEEPLYKAMELGEFLYCKAKYKSCEYAKDCWVMRRGYCQKIKETKREGKK